MFGVTGATMFCNANERKGLGLPNCGRDLVARYAVGDEVLFRYRQLAVVVAPVMGKLNFDPINDSAP
jgi:hypothetical protein